MGRGGIEYRGGRVRPHRSMEGKKTIERHGGEWWVSEVVYSLLLTDFSQTIKSLDVKDKK